MVAGVGFSLSRRVFHCLQARGMTVVTGVLRAGVLHGVRSDAGEGWLALLLVTKGRSGLASFFGWGWGGAGLGRSPQLGGRRCYKVKRIGAVRDQDVVAVSASKQPLFFSPPGLKEVLLLGLVPNGGRFASANE